MNKNIEAALRGYVWFRVNGKYSALYNSALVERKSIEGDVTFEGYHIWGGWKTFFLRCTFLGFPPIIANPQQLEIRE